tara:strand:- start:1220 stop:1450 length:231 start_codon:yes stop_codon:yes gene_type:complete
VSSYIDEGAKMRLRELLESGSEVDIKDIVSAVLGSNMDEEIVELVLMAVETMTAPVSNDQLINGINKLRLWREDNS